jgi:hypothetical protein
VPSGGVWIGAIILPIRSTAVGKIVTVTGTPHRACPKAGHAGRLVNERPFEVQRGWLRLATAKKGCLGAFPGAETNDSERGAP